MIKVRDSIGIKPGNNVIYNAQCRIFSTDFLSSIYEMSDSPKISFMRNPLLRSLATSLYTKMPWWVSFVINIAIKSLPGISFWRYGSVTWQHMRQIFPTFRLL
jgi:hypothetical protein